MNKKVLSFVNKLEGYKTAIKELHWDADNMSQHELCDKIAESIAEFQDTVSEVEQSITGKLATGNLKPEPYKVTTLKKFVEDVLDATNTFYKSLEKEGDTYTGMRSDCESFLSDMQRNLYLVNFTMKEDLKRRLTNRINESWKREENIKTTFHGTKPSTEKGLFKRINDLTKNGQLNTRVFNGVSDAFEFYNKILGNMGTLQTVEPNESIHIVKLDTNNGMAYYGLMKTKDEGDGRCKASITFSPHSDEMEQPDPEMSEPTIQDSYDYENMYEVHFRNKPTINESINAHDIFRDVRREIFNLKYKGRLSIPILGSDIEVPTEDDFLKAYFQSEDKLTVEFNGKKTLVDCNINANDDMLARCVMHGLAKLQLGKANESVIRMTGNELHSLIKESVKKIIKEGGLYGSYKDFAFKNAKDLEDFDRLKQSAEIEGEEEAELAQDNHNQTNNNFWSHEWVNGNLDLDDLENGAKW
jgi:hypothetical protein